MSRKGITPLIGGVMVVAIALVIFYIVPLSTTQPTPVVAPSEVSRSIVAENPRIATTSLPAHSYERLWLIGDVMLSRQVGEFADAKGSLYSWTNVLSLFRPTDAVLLNFESCISEDLEFTYSDSMRFPVPADRVQSLAMLPITHVSLANNHALDCGTDDFRYTLDTFTKLGITPVGHPVTVSSTSVGTTSVNGITVAIIALHTLFQDPELSNLRSLIANISLNSDFQVVFVHWGEEYQNQAHQYQHNLATSLAVWGVDLIVGHHPHVVQDISMIGDTLVVYSLGNFIFDQYFSVAVQEGLALTLSFSEQPQISLVPVTSLGTRTQPRPMTTIEREVFLASLAERSDPSLKTQILSGKVVLGTDLARSPAFGIIGP